MKDRKQETKEKKYFEKERFYKNRKFTGGFCPYGTYYRAWINVRG